MSIFKNSVSHPVSNVSKFKSFIYKHNTINIFIVFIFFYFLMSIGFSILYYSLTDGIALKAIIKFSLLSSFGFTTYKDITNTDLFFVLNLLHQMASLLMSTIFTAAIVLKYFYLPTFFIFKRKCNLVENGDESELIITLYNGSDLFVTNCHIRIYAREQSVDSQGTKSLNNINDKQPIFDYTYPFMDQHLATRLKIKFNQVGCQTLVQWFKERSVKGKKLDLILIVEANVNKLDSSVYEVHKYVIDSDDMEKTIDFREPVSIDLNYDDFSKSKGWDRFED